MKETQMNKTARKFVIVSILALAIMVAGISAALASEVTGTVGTSTSTPSTGTTTPSYTDGSLVASIVAPTSTPAAAPAAPSSVARSGHRRAPYGGAAGLDASDPVIIIDNGSIASPQALGTGGGYDPAAERAISAARSGSGNSDGVSPSDAIAYNNANNPFATNDLTAASGNNTGLGSAKVWTAIVLGLALLGLAGYAVNALMAYRRDNDL